MVFVEDAELLSQLRKAAVSTSLVAKRGRIIALVLLLLAPIGFLLGSAGCTAAWGNSYEYDEGLATLAGGIVALLCAAVSFVVYKASAITASRPITARSDQQAMLEGDQLTILYRNRGDVSVYGRVMIVINLAQSSFSMDPRTGIITFAGDVQEGYVHVNHGEISQLTEFTQVGRQVVANCFTPNLYQELIQYSNTKS